MVRRDRTFEKGQGKRRELAGSARSESAQPSQWRQQGPPILHHEWGFGFSFSAKCFQQPSEFERDCNSCSTFSSQNPEQVAEGTSGRARLFSLARQRGWGFSRKKGPKRRHCFPLVALSPKAVRNAWAAVDGATAVDDHNTQERKVGSGSGGTEKGGSKALEPIGGPGVTEATQLPGVDCFKEPPRKHRSPPHPRRTTTARKQKRWPQGLAP